MLKIRHPPAAPQILHLLTVIADNYFFLSGDIFLYFLLSILVITSKNIAL